VRVGRYRLNRCNDSIYAVTVKRIVVDTNVLVSATLSAGGAARQVLRLCLLEQAQPIIGNALFSEYEDVVSRDALFERARVTADERHVILDAFVSKCRWIHISWLWRPNLRDEADNHLIELAVAGDAAYIVTANLKDFRGSEMRFDSIRVILPAEYLSEEH